MNFLLNSVVEKVPSEVQYLIVLLLTFSLQFLILVTIEITKRSRVGQDPFLYCMEHGKCTSTLSMLTWRERGRVEYWTAAILAFEGVWEKDRGCRAYCPCPLILLSPLNAPQNPLSPFTFPSTGHWCPPLLDPSLSLRLICLYLLLSMCLAVSSLRWTVKVSFEFTKISCASNAQFPAP